MKKTSENAAIQGMRCAEYSSASGGLLLAQPLRSADFAICAGSLSDLLRRDRDRVCIPVLAILTTALVQNTINLLLVSAKH